MASGDATVECVDGGSEPVDFETLFKLRLSDKLDKLFENEPNLPTQFVLVPSLRDVFHEFVYPQVAFVGSGVVFSQALADLFYQQ